MIEMDAICLLFKNPSTAQIAIGLVDNFLNFN